MNPYSVICQSHPQFNPALTRIRRNQPLHPVNQKILPLKYISTKIAYQSLRFDMLFRFRLFIKMFSIISDFTNQWTFIVALSKKVAWNRKLLTYKVYIGRVAARCAWCAKSLLDAVLHSPGMASVQN